METDLSQTFRLREGSFETVKRRLILRALFMGALALAVGFGISTHSTGATSTGSLAVLIPLALACIGFGIYSGIRRERLSWQSYELLVSDGSITRRIAGHPEITLTPDSVSSITEAPNGAIIVRGPSVNRTIFIPNELIGLSECRLILTSWRPIAAATPRSGFPFIRILWFSTVPATLILMYVAYTATSPLLVAPAALVFAAGLIWCLCLIQRSPHYDNRIRRSAWFILIPVISVLIRAYHLLFP